MVYESSTAPKERVNIVYRPATGDSREEVELPLKLLVVGDFTLRGEATSIEDMKSINVDKDNFNEVLKGQKLALALVVPNHLEANPGSDAQLTVNLEFESIHDFAPDAVVQKVPELCQMIALRDALKALKGPLGNNPHFRKFVQASIVDEKARARLMGELGIADKRPESKAERPGVTHE
ncbi:type VI secretion system contractile sheath small subunit [Paraburkholderia sp. UYCP14C]|uniref:type VI secretion system contractile sheath small subunit n=1 Tax=Paraburkholderia sp. UYCP14C TaxID=2511130 RepID=UPI0010214D80|nr:type VI secretion system contractile sheath small subunit [Paraburkholderia sp. UYCP14C]RZF23565.1 type VI secretion system contractile sheath small subunit [Paraburkholderia sp. UYCP14C]